MPGDTDRVVKWGAIAISIIVVLILAATFTASVSPSTSNWVREQMHWTPQGYRVGAPSDLPAGLYSGANNALIVFATTNCDACRRAQGFHQTLLKGVEGNPSVRAQILLTSPSDDAPAYAAMLGIRPDQVATIEAHGTRVRRVPTILIVDRAGVVREIKEGVLPANEQHALLEKIRTLR